MLGNNGAIAEGVQPQRLLGHVHSQEVSEVGRIGPYRQPFQFSEDVGKSPFPQDTDPSGQQDRNALLQQRYRNRERAQRLPGTSVLSQNLEILDLSNNMLKDFYGLNFCKLS
jgi:hypothetical protein